ncbi:MAG: GtrA family protein [Betaproteobacteria bacterium]|nr:GtrA family protein [Betaproteobacteria bacterium]MDE2047538.1 GtrA family protein [Betaproteobacteria bacterium]
MPRQLLWFVLTGASAAAVHLGVVALLVQHFGWAPAVANVGGFAVAFWVSFAGHFWLTFRGAGAHWVAAALRFAAVAIGAFVVNQLAYVWLLARTPPQWYLAVLAAVLLAVAAGTFVLSRGWAFAHRGGR